MPRRRTSPGVTVLVVATVVVVGVGATTATAATPDRSVTAYQRGLADAGFYRGAVDGLEGPMTRAAVVTFEKAAGLESDGTWGRLQSEYLRDFEAVAPVREGEPDRVEIDLTNQVGYLIVDGAVEGVFGVSSGNDELYEHPAGYTGRATTPRGDFDFYRYYDGLWEAPLGELYRPWYFKGGFAIHGSASVPAWPASHGCVRVTNWDADWLSEHLEIGMPVHVWDGVLLEAADLSIPIWRGARPI